MIFRLWDPILRRRRFRRFITRVLAKRGWIWVVETRHGLKGLPMYDSADLEAFVVETRPFAEMNCSFEDFVICPDFLRNDFTLVGLPITESPHYSLIEAIAEGADLAKTEYVVRRQTGTLDIRTGSHVDLSLLEAWGKTSLQRIRRGERNSVKVFRLTGDGKETLVVGDGKHTLATAAFCGQTETLHIAMMDFGVYRDQFFARHFSQARKRRERYSRNLHFLERFYAAN
jgi:hypothetical protein